MKTDAESLTCPILGPLFLLTFRVHIFGILHKKVTQIQEQAKFWIWE
jgi:hypothetical protein